MNRTVLVCQNKTCRKSRSQDVLKALQHYELPDTNAIGSGCLGQCGNGPMVLILPEQIWYCRMRPDEVPALVDYHLRRGQLVQTMLYPKFHPAGWC